MRPDNDDGRCVHGDDDGRCLVDEPKKRRRKTINCSFMVHWKTRRVELPSGSQTRNWRNQ